jgi:hypothetical protein
MAMSSIEGLSASGYRVLWWLLEHMDREGYVVGAWITRASHDLRYTYLTVMRAKKALLKAGLIEATGKKRWIKVKARAFD